MILNSWKEIANYVGRGVRTIQRWEMEMQFPVHRTGEHMRSSVFALSEEVDKWLHHRTSARPSPSEQRNLHLPALKDRIARLRDNRQRLFSAGERVQKNAEIMQKHLKRAEELHNNLRNFQIRSRAS